MPYLDSSSDITVPPDRLFDSVLLTSESVPRRVIKRVIGPHFEEEKFRRASFWEQCGNRAPTLFLLGLAREGGLSIPPDENDL